MADISLEYVTDLDLSIVKVLSPVKLQDLKDFARDKLDIEPTRNVIWQIWPGSLYNLSIDDLKDFMGTRAPAQTQRKGGLTILVADTESDAALMKWYECYVKTLGNVPVAIYACNSMEKAIATIRDLCRFAAVS